MSVGVVGILCSFTKVTRKGGEGEGEAEQAVEKKGIVIKGRLVWSCNHRSGYRFPTSSRPEVLLYRQTAEQTSITLKFGLPYEFCQFGSLAHSAKKLI